MAMLLIQQAAAAWRACRFSQPVWRMVMASSLCLCMFCLGCASEAKSSSLRFAVVTLQGNTPGQIHDAAIEVFRAHGYQSMQADLAHMTFEKRATSLSNLSYGNWGDDPPLTVRVKADILPDGEQTHLLQCQAYMVRDRGNALEEEIKMGRLKNGPYQALLDEVAKRLQGPTAQPKRQ